MASPPFSANSPPGPASLALPKQQRPSLALPTGLGSKSRKPSIASATSSAHPLRQTSFPPTDQHASAHFSRQYSPGSPNDEALGPDDDLDFSDSEIVSAISGPAGPADDTPATNGKKRKKHTGRMGRPPKASKTGSASLANGSEGGAKSRKSAAPASESDDSDDEAGMEQGKDGAPLSTELAARLVDLRADADKRNLFRKHLEALEQLPLTHPSRHGITRRDFTERHDVWNRVKIRPQDVKKLVNQVLGQSVPQPVVAATTSMLKIFAGVLVEGAREVQREMVVVEQRGDGGDGGGDGKAKEVPKTNGETTIKTEDAATPASTQPLPQDAAPGPPQIENCDLGPLTPDHLRESLRRYKKARKGGAVGFTGYSLEGAKGAAARMGGKRLFR